MIKYRDSNIISVSDISCVVDASTVEILSHSNNLIFESNAGYFPLEWIVSPPMTYIEQNFETNQGDFSFENILYVQVNTPSNDVMTYSWTVNTPHSILVGRGVHDNLASIQLEPSGGSLTTSVIATNICLSESDSLSFTTIIN